MLRCDGSISIWRLYPLSGTSGLDIIYYAHTFFGQFIPCSFKRSYGRIRVKTKNRLLCQLCFHFQVFFPGIRQPRDAHLFKEKYHVLY